MKLEDLIKMQIALIENGKPLESFAKFFSDTVIMQNNNTVFASNKKDGMEIQVNFFKSITNFKAIVYYSSIKDWVSTLGIRYSFMNSEKEQVRFEGIHKQKWEDGLNNYRRFLYGRLFKFT